MPSVTLQEWNQKTSTKSLFVWIMWRMAIAEKARHRREKVGFVFQTGNLIPALTALDQLRLALDLAGRGSDPRELLDRVGMGHRAGHRPHQLSGGERQRVGIARALVTRPAVLLVDEPTAAVDRNRAADLTALIARTTHRYGCVTVVATHDPVVTGAADATVDMLHHTVPGQARGGRDGG